MAWFTAHLIIGLIVPDEDSVVAWENIVLIEADNHDKAMSLALEIGRDEESLKDGLMIDGKPARRKFAGVRKIANIFNYTGRMNDDPPSHRCELTHSEYILKNVDQLVELGQGKDVLCNYVV